MQVNFDCMCALYDILISLTGITFLDFGLPYVILN